MNEMWIYLTELSNTEVPFKHIRASVLLLIGFIAAKSISRLSLCVISKIFTSHTSQLLQRGTYYLIFMLFFFRIIRTRF